MAKKHLSLIIVPHCAKRFKTITLSQKAINALLSLAVFSVVVLAVFMVDYFTMSVTRAKYRSLLKENAEQNKLLSDYKSSISKLSQTVESLKSYTEKLNVMAGLKSSEVLKEIGIGGGDVDEMESDKAPGGPQLKQTLTLQDPRELADKAENLGKNLDILTSFFEVQAAKLASTPTIWPTIGWVSSPFSNRIDPFTGKRTFHYGIDIATNFGNPVVATADGYVLTLGTDKMSGRYVVLSHGGGLTTHYLHLSKFLVKSGQKIKRGDVIGLVGKSGKALGPHLHYEVRLNNRPQNPYQFILEE
ncbi:MAG: peptidoglycan DD-metalloendopeptidase family protein [Clostridiales bacterium]|nr:peptidoglycan DD-metalloendopeptidase family protein [Clostridiales bacterium]